jgi:hypothetical protein
MPWIRLLSAGLLSAAVAACGSGSHNTADAEDGAAGADSLSAGTDVAPAPPPVGTVNPAAPSGPGTYGDSASPAAVGGPTPTGAAGGPAQPATRADSAADDGVHR